MPQGLPGRERGRWAVLELTGTLQTLLTALHIHIMFMHQSPLPNFTKDLNICDHKDTSHYTLTTLTAQLPLSGMSTVALARMVFMAQRKPEIEQKKYRVSI